MKEHEIINAKCQNGFHEIINSDISVVIILAVLQIIVFPYDVTRPFDSKNKNDDDDDGDMMLTTRIHHTCEVWAAARIEKRRTDAFTMFAEV